jgi:hypothetical protein
MAETAASAESFKAGVDSACAIPYYVTRGNHDLPLSYWRPLYGPENYCFDHKGYRFIAIDTYHDDGAAYDFLDSVLALTDTAMGLIGFSHYPIAPGAPYRLRDSQGDSIIAKFANHNLVAWFSGHSHSWHDTVYNGVSYYTTDGMQYADNPWTTDRGYRLVNVWDDSISAEPFEVGNPPTEFIPNDTGSFIEAYNGSLDSPELTLSVFPNPFNSRTAIHVRGIRKEKRGKMSIFDINGRLIEERTFLFPLSSFLSLTWNATGLPAGVYLLRLKIRNRQFTKKLLVQK